MDTWERSCRMAFPLRGEGRAARFVITVKGESREVAAAMRNYLFTKAILGRRRGDRLSVIGGHELSCK